jgi:hypothetical protein
LALADLNKGIALDPMNLNYRNNKARILRRQGDYMEAINQTMIHRAIETQPEYVRASSRKACVFRIIGPLGSGAVEPPKL